MFSAVANSTLDIRDSISEQETAAETLSRSRRVTVLEDSVTGDILEILSEIQETDDSDDDSAGSEYERAGQAAAQLMSSLVLSANFRSDS